MKNKTPLKLLVTDSEPDVEELIFNDKNLTKKAVMIVRLLELTTKEADADTKRRAALAKKSRKSDLIDIR